MIEHLRVWVEAHTPNVFRVILILALAWVVSRILKGLIRRIERLADDGDPKTTTERERRAQTVTRILRQASFVMVWSVTAMLVLAELGMDLKPILAGAGTLGLAVGFGAQALVKDVITGFFILLENQISVGDSITAAGCSGVVEAVNLRTLVLRDDDGKTHIIPNSAITVVTNATRDWSRALVDVAIAYKEDTDRAGQILKDIVDDMRREPEFRSAIRGDLELWGIDKVDGSMVSIVGQIRCTDSGRWPVQREFNRRMKLHFQQNGIEIASSAQTILMQIAPPVDPVSNLTPRRATG